MSHLPERKEKHCLNCGAATHGRFCHVCGQENIEPKESFWHLLTHFTYDVTHFDGKFFSTLKYLLFRPGYLSHEYLKGRRADYLHPIRMYVFTSAFFFLVFFSFYQKDEDMKVTTKPASAAATLKRWQEKHDEVASSLADSSLPAIARLPLQRSLDAADSNIAVLKRDSTKVDSLLLKEKNFALIEVGKRVYKYRSVAEYDSMEHLMPPSKRDNFIVRKIVHQNIHLNEKYGGDKAMIIKAIVNKFRHLFPQILFVSLPLFALALLLLYARRQRFFYVNHVVYTIHLYCATFIIILAGMAVNSLFKAFSIPGRDWITVLFSIVGFFYWYKAMRNFYEQSRGKTVLKYFLVLLISLFIMVFLFSIFFIFSAMAI